MLFHEVIVLVFGVNENDGLLHPFHDRGGKGSVIYVAARIGEVSVSVSVFCRDPAFCSLRSGIGMIWHM